MKKFLLSLAVIVAFGVYVAYQRTTGSMTYAALPAPTSSMPSDQQSQSSDVSANQSGNNQSQASVPVSTTPPTNPSTTGGTSKTVKTVSGYKNGTYTGDSADAFYGTIQVKVVISNGKITDVQFLDYPQDRRTSIMINSQAMPILRSEAIAAQSSKVNTVSGASDTSDAFRQSLSSALAQAKA